MIDYSITIGDDERNALLGIALHDKAFQKMQRTTKIGIIALGACVVLVGVAANSMLYIVAGILFAIFGIFGVGPVQKAAATKTLKKADPKLVSGTRQYKVDEDGVQITSSMGTGVNKWDSFCDFGEYDHYIWLKRADRHMLLFDKNQLSEEQIQELKGYLSANVRP